MGHTLVGEQKIRVSAAKCYCVFCIFLTHSCRFIVFVGVWLPEVILRTYKGVIACLQALRVDQQ